VPNDARKIRFWTALYGSGALGIALLFLIALALDGGTHDTPSMLTVLGVLGVFDIALMVVAKLALRRLKKP